MANTPSGTALAASGVIGPVHNSGVALTQQLAGFFLLSDGMRLTSAKKLRPRMWHMNAASFAL